MDCGTLSTLGYDDAHLEHKMKASVVIPTKNGGEPFKRVLDEVIDQTTPWQYEILVVDSGSTDDTLHYCAQKGVRVHTIAASEFGHGKTRNLAISLTTGEFIALITHDARPASKTWLQSLVAAVEASGLSHAISQKAACGTELGDSSAQNALPLLSSLQR